MDLRARIMELLNTEQRDISSTEIAKRLDAKRKTIQQYMLAFFEDGVVDRYKVGADIYYKPTSRMRMANMTRTLITKRWNSELRI